MKKFVALLTKEKGKTAMNEWENGDFEILRALYSVYKKISAILYPYLLVNPIFNSLIPLSNFFTLLRNI